MKNRGITGKRHVLAVGAASALALGALGALSAAASAAATTAVAPNETTSQPNPGPLPALDGPDAAKVRVGAAWAGYVATGGKAPFTYVAATFRVAAVNCGKTPHDSWTAQWVGLDGWYGETVEQIGVESECGNDRNLPPNAAHYEAWWEMYHKVHPDSNKVHVIESVKAGDLIEAQVWEEKGGPHDGVEYYLGLQDVTKDDGVVHSIGAFCPTVCKNDTAEVVEEGYNKEGWHGPADFGREMFSDISLGQFDDEIGNFETKSWTNLRVYQAQENSHHELTEDAYPTALLDGGTKFSVVWLSDK